MAGLLDGSEDGYDFGVNTPPEGIPPWAFTLAIVFEYELEECEDEGNNVDPLLLAVSLTRFTYAVYGIYPYSAFFGFFHSISVELIYPVQAQAPYP